MNHNKMNKSRNNKDKSNKTYKDGKGFWEYSIFQKKHVENDETNIKNLLKPVKSFDPKLIDQYINPTLSGDEIIVNKVNNNKKITKIEKIKYDNYINKRNTMIQEDMKEIKNLGKDSKVKTQEGKLELITYLLENEIKKYNESDNEVKRINVLDRICNLYLKLKEPRFKFSNKIINTNETNQDILNDIIKNSHNILNKVNTIIKDVDFIEFQFLKLYSQMPPLNQKGFSKLDEWQISVINNINNNCSTVVSAPTSAGKTILSGYTVTKGRTLFVVPTDALAWQVSSYLTEILGLFVPIITLTYVSCPKRDEFIPKLNAAKAIVGTADCILDYLPLINCNFSWIILDEIHMIGKNEGFAMESIMKIFNNIPFLALSATIGNVNEFVNWIKVFNNTDIDIIKCNKRFFNLQKYYFEDNEYHMINPLSMTNIKDFENRNVINKNFDPTPLDTWALYEKIKAKHIQLNELDPYCYFDRDERIELSKATKYFYDIISFLSINYETYKNEIKEILDEFSNVTINNNNNNLYNIITNLKDEDKLPVIIFQQNTISCLEIVRNLSNQIDLLEQKAHPKLYQDRNDNNKQVKKNDKKVDKNEKKLTEKKEFKNMLEQKAPVIEIVEEIINAPAPDFIFTKIMMDSDIIKGYHEKFKIYFPNINGDYHFLLRLLWRGIGVYCVGLPDDYLRVVQTLANDKKLPIVFSDISLVFGVSMPFRSVVVYNDDNCIDNLDPMIYHQMAGRAGRRGLDKEGHIFFVGYTWDRIKELSTSYIPNINGMNKLIYTYQNGNVLCNSANDYTLINKNMLYNNINLNMDESKMVEYNDFNTKLKNRFDYMWSDVINENINNNYLMWMLRYSIDSITSFYIIPYLQKYFTRADPNNENDQVAVAYFLSKFIHIKYTNDNNYLLSNYLNGSKIDYNEIYLLLKSKNINIEDNIDATIWVSIRNNNLVESNEVLRQEIFDYSTKIKHIQHYCFHNNYNILAKLLAKLLTRIWWIYHQSGFIVR